MACCPAGANQWSRGTRTLVHLAVTLFPLLELARAQLRPAEQPLAGSPPRPVQRLTKSTTSLRVPVIMSIRPRANHMANRVSSHGGFVIGYSHGVERSPDEYERDRQHD